MQRLKLDFPKSDPIPVQAGLVVASSVTKKLDLLVAADPNTTARVTNSPPILLHRLRRFRLAQAAIVLPAEDADLSNAVARLPSLTVSDHARSHAWPAEPSTPAFGPIIGHPHPNSQAELKLHRSISQTEDLRALFRWNQVVHVSPAVTPKVDLVWPEGKLLVEIDGWADHSTREKFESDRHREYELIASGYLVLRVSNDEVLTDTERVLEKLRRVVLLRAAQHE